MESAGMICRSVLNASYWDRRRLCNGVGGDDLPLGIQRFILGPQEAL